MPISLRSVGGWCPVIDQLTSNPRYKLPGAAVFGVVWRYCQMQDGYCRAAQETLGKKIGLSRKTVNRYLKLLTDDGYLEDLTPGIKNISHIYTVTNKINLSPITDTREQYKSEANPDNSNPNGVTLGDTGVTDGVTVSYPNTLGINRIGNKNSTNKGLQKSQSSPSAIAEEKSSSAHADNDNNGDKPQIIKDIKIITDLYPPRDTWQFLIEKFPNGIADIYLASCYFQYARAKHISPFSYGVWLIEWYSTDGYYMHEKDKAKFYDLYVNPKDHSTNEEE